MPNYWLALLNFMVMFMAGFHQQRIQVCIENILLTLVLNSSLQVKVMRLSGSKGPMVLC
eukprot:c38757_g1_i1 orf=1-174(-)